jgi:methionine synthase / methylenetetrahydrofolate reductase(NADPH)
MSASIDRCLPGDAPVLLDGAMGTALRSHGWPVSEATVLANLDAPGLVASVHQSYRTVGAAVLHTNTFGALLGTAGAESRRIDAVRAGVRLAHRAAAGEALVAGSLGAYDLAFHGPRLTEVVRALVEEGVDLLVFETCNQVRDAQVALEVRAQVAPRLPAVICASSTDGSHEDVKRVAEVLAVVAASDADVERGLNCCRGPQELYKLALAQPEMPRWLKPSAGPPDDPADDNVLAAFARAARQSGARFLGGCCGTTADTLQLMASALRA